MIGVTMQLWWGGGIGGRTMVGPTAVSVPPAGQLVNAPPIAHPARGHNQPRMPARKDGEHDSLSPQGSSPLRKSQRNLRILSIHFRRAQPLDLPLQWAHSVQSFSDSTAPFAPIRVIRG